jgi:hypothetical protein
MKGSVIMTLFPRDSEDIQEDVTSFMMNYPKATPPNEIYKALENSNPNLYREAFNLGIIPPSKSRLNIQEQKNAIRNNLTKGEFVTKEKAKQFESMPEGQVPFLIDQIIRNADEYIKNGYVDVNGVINQVDDIQAIEYAIKNQVKGITWSEQEGFLGIGEDIATYDARPNQEHKLGANIAERISKGKHASPQEAQRFFDLPESQKEFKLRSIPERLEIVKYYEEMYDMTLDVDPELLEPNALDEEEEKETLSIENVSEKYKISEELVNTLISKKPKRGPVEVQRPFREDPIDLITDQMLADSGYIDSIYAGALLKSLAKRKFIKDFYNDLGN